jgi:hypothetical protein
MKRFRGFFFLRTRHTMGSLPKVVLSEGGDWMRARDGGRIASKFGTDEIELQGPTGGVK